MRHGVYAARLKHPSLATAEVTTITASSIDDILTDIPSRRGEMSAFSEWRCVPSPERIQRVFRYKEKTADALGRPRDDMLANFKLTGAAVRQHVAKSHGSRRSVKLLWPHRDCSYLTRLPLP